MDDFLKKTDKISNENWQRLFKIIPQIENSDNFGRMKMGEKISERLSFMPYWETTSLVSDFQELVYEIGLIVDFDWMKWKEENDIIENEAIDYSKLDFEILCKLIIAIVRNDKYCDGYLISCFKKGIILKILKQLEYQINAKDNFQG